MSDSPYKVLLDELWEMVFLDLNDFNSRLGMFHFCREPRIEIY